MSELIEQAKHAVREAADTLVQERSAETLRTLQDHFKQFATVPTEGRAAWVAAHNAQLLNQAEQAFKACEKFNEKYWIAIAPGIFGVKGDQTEQVTSAQKTVEALRLTVMVISLFDRFTYSDFLEQSETVADIFGWLHDVIVKGAGTEIVLKRTLAVQLLAKKRAAFSVHELQAEISSLAFGSYENRGLQAPFKKVHEHVWKALNVHGFYLSLVGCDVNVDGKVDAAAHAEATKTSLMMQAMQSIGELLGNVHLFEQHELPTHSHELSILFKRMGELLTVVSEHVPGAPSDATPTKPKEPAPNKEDSSLGDNVVRLGSHKKKRTLH